MALSKAEKSELKLRHGEVLSLEEQEGTFLFKKPTKQLYSQFLASMTSDRGKKGDDRLVYFEQLCIGCLVYPEKAPGEPNYELLMQLFERLPGASLSVGGELQEMAGASDSLKLGKL